MNGLTARLQRQIPKVIALLLCFWLSGAACVLNCNLTGANVAGESIQTASADDENLPPCHRAAKSSEVDDKNKPSLADAPNFPPLECCPLFNAALERAKEFQLAKIAAQPASPVKFSAPIVAQRESAFHSSYKPPPASRGSTYLRNCVFLI